MRGGPHPGLTDLMNGALNALLTTGDWSTGPPDLPCHSAHVIVYRAPAADVSIHICCVCLQAYMETQGAMVGPDTPSPTVMTRACHRCGQEYPLADFVARNGSITVFCTGCRTAWGKHKRAQEEAATKAADDAALAKAASGLRRLEKELSDEE